MTATPWADALTTRRMIFAEPTAAFAHDGHVYGFIPAGEVAIPAQAVATAWANALRELCSDHSGSDNS